MIIRDGYVKFVRIVCAGFYIFNATGFPFILSLALSRQRGTINHLDFFNESSSCTDHISQLNEENKRLQEELENFMHQNRELRLEMTSLLSECRESPSHCEWDDSSHPDGDTWFPDACTTCSCENGVPNCHASYQNPVCGLQCFEGMCLNGGTCHLGLASHSIQCHCPHGFSGPLCEQRSCIPVKVEGNCGHQRTWYFDSHSNLCKPVDSGCYDPGTTFSSFEMCAGSCLQGTCCYRMAISQDMICQVDTMENCQILCQEERVEVVGFYPGIQCPNDGCALISTKTCHIGTALYSPGSKFLFGCDSCECLEEQISCSCHALSMRREIRELSEAERIQYQRTLAKLQIGDDRSVWNSLRNLYITHIMHANSPVHFLFWNRLFLRTMERHLQELDCSTFIPYFDFTLDVGHLQSSVVWEKNYFGRPEGNGSGCQRYIIPKSDVPWTPCITRVFQLNSSLPTMVDVAIALSKLDFLEFSSAVQKIASSLHSFIGGDMDTEGCPDDPIFYSLYAYVDMLFWKWQKRHFKVNSAFYDDPVLRTVLRPFNTESRYLIDSEKNLCVSYQSIGSDEQSTTYQKRHNYDYNHNTFEYGFPPNECDQGDCYEPEMRTILNAGHEIQSVLYQQHENFLLTVPRSCSSSEVKPQFINKAWNVKTGHFEAWTNTEVLFDRVTHWSQRFCFPADLFFPPENASNARPCHLKQVPVCDAKALSKCPYYPYVPCRLSLCGNCSLTCHVNNQDVDCSESKEDFCSPNPCKNNGICRSSRWPMLPHLITCDCPPGFEGEFCEEISDQRCFLPQNSGIEVTGCGSVSKRWYFDLPMQTCRSFQYRGCLGNANNFLTYYECRVACMIGACCWRMPLNPNIIHGYNKEGYDRYGFNGKGQSPKKGKRTFDNGYGGEEKIFRFLELDYQGYDKRGYNVQGLDRFGYNSEGFHYLTKFNLTGFNALGDHEGITDYDQFGYNSEGYNRAGLNCFGSTKDGWDYYGLASGWSFACRAMNLHECRNIEKEFLGLHTQVVSFSFGKKCEEVNCEYFCGCNFLESSIPVGTKFPLGCGTCECALSRRISCPCTTISIRKEIRDMEHEEILRYQNAVKSLVLQKHPSIWSSLIEMYRKFLPISRSDAFFLPWHRYFTRFAEMKMQEIDCSVTIPYFDWTLDVGNMESSIVWQANMFGGNGDLAEDYCVKHHPFKTFHSNNWKTCLRRNFNNSIHLPNAVDLEKIYRLETFAELSSRLNEISGLFHLFVGGHMVTPDAAYDPIFLSFYAFIDKIWYEWSLRNPNNIEKFPQNIRYISMPPFGLTPDDVLLSMTQLCVTYLQITEGAACVPVQTEIPPPYSDSSKRIVDVDGYDSEGYNQFGFDRFGWDRNGFYKDSFNRDGFDTSGYDRQGYNRYGINRNGCNTLGHCFNDVNIDVTTASWDDFNMMGLRSNGLDFHGYDIYGFDVNGFDKENCSHLFLGPFYPKLMKSIKLKLRDTKTNNLKEIQRICPVVSSLPFWWLNVYWLNQNEHILIWSLAIENSFSPFLSTPDIWLAPTPDQRFCFPLQIHTQCDLHQAPIPCPFQKCQAQFCMSQPSAMCRPFGCGTCDHNFLDLSSQKATKCNENAGCLAIDGSFRIDEEHWQDLETCHTCICKTGEISCSQIICDSVCDHPVMPPNACCPVCDGCMKNNILYRNADTFIDSQNPCLECNCKNGTILCTAVECAPMRPCKKNAVMTLPGECCPKCSMCGPHHEGSHWMESPCHNCTCEEGHVHCSVLECPMPRCQYPARDVGECCRHCDDCEYRGSYVRDQESFSPENCQDCQCQKGNISCQVIDCDHPKCQDENESADGCCDMCQKGCLYDGSEYRDGDVFSPAFNPCLNCSCKKSLVRCQPVTCPVKEHSCVAPVFLPGKCCPECLSCLYENQQYSNGARWRATNDSCEMCRCIDGNILCSTTCLDKKCTHGVLRPEECCSSCTECQYNNHVVPNHLQFSPPNDPCVRCICEEGNITCVRETCPKLLCRLTELPAGACCPVCKSCKNSIGQSMEHGQKWIHPTDICQVCSCEDGSSKCERIECEIPCTHPVVKISHCCPECNDCQVSGRIYLNNIEIPSSDPCRKCFCYRGSMECESVRCPAVTCDVPEKKRGDCCPSCQICIFQGDTYQDGQTFQPKTDACYKCICEKGVVQCERKDKCNPQCSDPEQLPNQCCPVCDGCEYEGKTYRNREHFIPNTLEACLECECVNGNVKCFQKNCPRLNCPVSTKLPGECCSECVQVCHDKISNKTYEEGAMWVPADDVCKLCSCEQSVSICKLVDCPLPRCSHAAAPFGVCCRECEHCEFTQRLYRNGQEFTHEDDPCQICQCVRGNVTCETIFCDPLPCAHPEELEGLCCPVCAPDVRCRYLGKTYEAWENFMDPTNPCSECVCMDGMVSCHQVLCLNSECPNPQLGSCCDSCEGCSYGDTNYLNHASFRDPFQMCRECQCDNGVVSCQQQTCGTSCQHPILQEGQCCPMCEAHCTYKDNTYSNGEHFIDPEDSCIECYCEYSQVYCQVYDCEENSCISPHGSQCCESCSDCIFLDALYEAGSSFSNPQNPCEMCTCQAGNVSCFEEPCLPAHCSHPVLSNCCWVCNEGCLFEGTIYRDLEELTDSQSPCHVRLCENGNIISRPVECSPVTCEYPAKDDCCSVCIGCFYKGESIGNGQKIDRDGSDTCQECICKDGNVECHRKACPTVHCSDPVMENCCPVCHLGCFYKGEHIENGQRILQDGPDTCQECVCHVGNVECRRKACPTIYCSDPIIEKCCPVCHLGCFYKGERISNGQRIGEDGPDTCQECVCNDGNVKCGHKACPAVPCSDPVMENCCPVCHLGCSYKGKRIGNGQRINQNWPDICQECICNDGNVDCHHKVCPTAHCSDPVMENCCSVCHLGCFYKGKRIGNGQRIDQDGSDTCQECNCNDGNVECRSKVCPTVHCSDPVIENCCPVCHLGCFYYGKIYDLGAEFDSPEDLCSECACMDGSIHCDRKPCEPTFCNQPITDDGQCCPTCPPYCVYGGQRYENGSAFPDNTDACKECRCMSGDVVCKLKACPEISCLHPALGECCLECEKCEYLGEIRTDGNNFTNPNEPCETCHCSKGQVACRRKACAQCLHPYWSEFECCPLCDGCFYKGRNYTNQELFSDPGNACQECICKNGTVTCHELSCSLPSCSNPLYQTGVCCPLCPGCSFSGSEFQENEEFNHPDNVCEKCICKDSQVVCKKQVCYQNCTHPLPDPCCPICNSCMFETVQYFNGQRFHPDPCKTCECKDGNVLCTSEQCPELQCHLRTRLPGMCCETCRGCVYEGIEYENGETWSASSNPCLFCSCYGGTVSCMNIVCPIECAEPIPLPGRCCPLCPECEKDGIKYKSGQVFSPPDNPCDSCTCDSGHIFCIRYECPPLIGCPEESIKPPGEGKCCPTCASFGTTCTRDQIGILVYPSQDPCFVCQCTDSFMWVCSKEFCPPLNCPEKDILASEKECCPKCKVCISEEVHLHGDSWTHPNDLCNLCSCNYGHIKCSTIACPEIKCEKGEFEFRPPGECCAVCTSSRDFSCDYGGSYYEHGQAWNPDPCTTCQCLAGKMNCINERCLPLSCSSDEIKSVDPGQCCPKCIPRPATCIAFGDPHYRTFDGAAISFQGTCRYVLTADCFSQKFNVLVENNDRGFNGVSWTHRVVVVLQNASVDLRSGPTVYIKGKQIEQLPYFEDPVMYVENTGTSVLVTTNVGVQVLWSGDGYVEVIVSGVYREKTCGLCGNFNNFPEDDMRTPTNEIVSSEAKFGNSWKTPGNQAEGCSESTDIDPCSKGGYRIRKMANNKCSILKYSLFAACHRFIPPETYFAACVYDVCACSENDDCLCDILSAYSKECSKAGIIVHWRSEGMCGIHCSYEEGLVFDECGPPCPRTCENKYVPIGILAAQCFKPCVPGCQCSADKVLHNGRCITPDQCP